MCDVETGGFPNKTQKAVTDIALVEVAIVVIDVAELKIIDTYSDIVEEYKEDLIYTKEAEAVHCITKEMIREHGKPIKEVVNNVKKILEKYKNPRRKAILGGHNITTFDRHFFQNMFEFVGLDLWDYVGDIEDTLKIAGYAATEQENYKLGTCCSYSGVDLVESHRALSDTEANALLMIEYLKKLRGIGSSSVTQEKEQSRFREDFEIDK